MLGSIGFLPELQGQYELTMQIFFAFDVPWVSHGIQAILFVLLVYSNQYMTASSVEYNQWIETDF